MNVYIILSYVIALGTLGTIALSSYINYKKGAKNASK